LLHYYNRTGHDRVYKADSRTHYKDDVTHYLPEIWPFSRSLCLLCHKENC